MYLAVSGNIGSGKSSLTELLSGRYGLQAVYEAVSENPYLEDFYHDMARYSFHSQIFFLSRRLEQHLLVINGASGVIQDRTLFEDAMIFAQNLYATGKMDARDWETYFSLYCSILPALRSPDLLIYIRASLPTLRQRIAKRGRDFEQEMSDDYLEGLNVLYAQWLEGYGYSRVLVIDGDELDFISDPSAFETICSRIEALDLGIPLLS
jgi:deoxyadenosine/deoxycytidine kinase